MNINKQIFWGYVCVCVCMHAHARACVGPDRTKQRYQKPMILSQIKINVQSIV